jgi:hypothetical protein
LIGLYRSLLEDGDDIKTLVAEQPLSMPVLAVGAGGGAFMFGTMSQVKSGEVRSVMLDGVGH